jgi:DNA-binding response OmpR family regulator
VEEQPRLLIVDDDDATATMLRRSLSRHGFRVDAVGSAAQARELAAANAYDAAILDLVMPDQDGAELAGALREKLPGLPVALLTGYTHSPLLAKLQRSGVKVFTKPVAVQEIVDFLRGEIA